MDYYSGYINQLIEQLSHLPGIGVKTAQRLAFHIMNMPADQAKRLADSITEAKSHVQYCKCCQTLTDKELCPICANVKRDHSVIMVVETTQDLAAYEKTGKYSGVYHVLHGAISPMLGTIAYSNIRGRYFYKISEVKRMLEERLIRSNKENIQDLITNHQLYAKERGNLRKDK